MTLTLILTNGSNLNTGKKGLEFEISKKAQSSNNKRKLFFR